MKNQYSFISPFTTVYDTVNRNLFLLLSENYWLKFSRIFQPLFISKHLLKLGTRFIAIESKKSVCREYQSVRRTRLGQAWSKNYWSGTSWCQFGQHWSQGWFLLKKLWIKFIKPFNNWNSNIKNFKPFGNLTKFFNR